MNEYLRIQKANDTLEHINENNERFNQFLKTKNDNYEKMKQKNDLNNIEKNLNVKRMEQQKQFLRENLNEEIKEREKQILENKKKLKNKTKLLK